MFGTVSRYTFQDRADVIARTQRVIGQTVLGNAESVIARNVPCAIRQEAVSRLATLLGFQQTSGLSAVFGDKPEVRIGYIVRVISMGREYRYVVKEVGRFPAPHRCDWQVARLTMETMNERA